MKRISTAVAWEIYIYRIHTCVCGACPVVLLLLSRIESVVKEREEKRREASYMHACVMYARPTMPPSIRKCQKLFPWIAGAVIS